MSESLAGVTMREVRTKPGTLEITATGIDGVRFQTRVTGEGFTPQQLERLFLAFHALLQAAIERDPYMVEALGVRQVPQLPEAIRHG